ncbi:MAG TPA: hypothetical protein VEI46_04075 [Thermodesulfovibrionales bacterium]|nr:hypothetical protein [Thermodesulfovibrionales bacterium]
MALKSVTLRLDEDEYEKLKEYLSEFGDPDISVAYVLRSYIRDLNRALPFVKSGWDLKNYFGMLGSWLKQFSSMQDQEMFAKMMMNPWALWGNPSSRGYGEEGKDTVESGKGSEEKHDKGKGKKA